jgi:hypothetical protein
MAIHPVLLIVGIMTLLMFRDVNHLLNAGDSDK